MNTLIDTYFIIKFLTISIAHDIPLVYFSTKGVSMRKSISKQRKIGQQLLFVDLIQSERPRSVYGGKYTSKVPESRLKLRKDSPLSQLEIGGCLSSAG